MKTRIMNSVAALASAFSITAFNPGVLTSIAVIAPVTLVSVEAKACRDCPFPMKVRDGVWIMPNEKVEVRIEKIKLPSRFEEVRITLHDPETGVMLASGIVKQKRGRKTVNMQLFDKDGREVKGFVRFVDEERAEIQARFTCEECEIGTLLDQRRR
jgi:hypothetical protein